MLVSGPLERMMYSDVMPVVQLCAPITLGFRLMVKPVLAGSG